MSATHFQGRVIDGRDDADLASADVTLGGNWGTSPSVAVAAGSKDRRGRITVTSGSGSPGANPTAQITLKDKFKDEDGGDLTPFAVGSRGDTQSPAGGYWALTARAAASVTFTFVGTPAASTAYVLDFEILG